MAVDLVNLRNEEYTEGSRVPIIRIGTPEEDAYRRDLTINALFYNINESKIEDFTKMGIDDLKNRIIRTPLDPLQTFLDDPLRVLRTIRFATRFQFTIDEKIHKVAKDPQIKEALAKKISNERIGTEMDLMLGGRFPEDSIKYLYEYQILEYVFKFPENCEELKNKELLDSLLYKSLKEAQIVGEIFKHIRDQKELGTVDYSTLDIPEFQRNTIYAALLIPFKDFEYELKNKKKEKVFSLIVSQSFKRPNESLKIITSCLNGLDKALQLANSDFNKLKTGLFLREVGENWKAVMILCIAVEYFESTKNKEAASTNLIMDFHHLNSLLQKYQEFNLHIANSGLKKVHEMKPILDGNSIQNLYEIKPGKILRHLIEELIEWQILQEKEYTKEEATEFLQSNKEHFLNKYQ